MCVSVILLIIHCACLRRKQKRARKQAEEAAKTAEKVVQSVIAEKAPEKVTTDILDEFCEDEAYNSNVDNVNENFIDEIWVTPEGQTIIDKETLEEKLDAVGITAKEIETIQDNFEKYKAIVKIEPASKEKITGAMFPLRVSGLKKDLAAG